ncbi:MAG: hypothetical protein ABSC30_07790 [Acidimicrobiales bacterium]|jgi:hypothetical protein
MGDNTLEVQESGTGAVQPGFDGRDGGVLLSRSDEEVHVVRAQLPAGHHPETLQSQPVRFLQGEASKEAITVNHQHEERP